MRTSRQSPPVAGAGLGKPGRLGEPRFFEHRRPGVDHDSRMGESIDGREGGEGLLQGGHQFIGVGRLCGDRPREQRICRLVAGGCGADRRPKKFECRLEHDAEPRAARRRLLARGIDQCDRVSGEFHAGERPAGERLNQRRPKRGDRRVEEQPSAGEAATAGCGCGREYVCGYENDSFCWLYP